MAEIKIEPNKIEILEDEDEKPTQPPQQAQPTQSTQQQTELPIAKAITQYGHFFYLTTDFYIAQSLKKNILYEQELVENILAPHIKRSKCILDVGAHIGCHSIIYSKLSPPQAQVHSFEMQTPLYHILKRNMKQNNCDNVTLYNCAVGNKTKMIEINANIIDGPNADTPFDYTSNRDFNYGGVQIGKGGDEHMMIHIDSLNLSACDFIKVDVEGAEMFVIYGALETIRKYKPTIFYESNFKQPSEEMYKVMDIPWENKLDENGVAILLRGLGYRKFNKVGMNILAEY
jgi:FkbM family methyltransferase